MKVTLVDYKNNEMLNIKVEVNQYMYVVAPNIIDPKFNYMRPRLMDVRAKYMKLFLENTGLPEVYERKITDEMMEVLLEEVKKIHAEEGIMYYPQYK